MIQALYDIRFAFDSDNPFDSDTTKTHLNKLKKYLAENAETFTEIDYLENSKYLMVCPDLKTIFGEDVNKETFISDKLNDEVKRFIKDNIPKLPEDLQKWVANAKPSGIKSAAISALNLATTASAMNISEDIDAAIADLGNSIFPSMDNKMSPSLSIGLAYDISSDKSISYEELCKLCMNIARTKLVESNDAMDPMVATLEKEKRKKLTYEICRYKSNTLIAPWVEADLTEMSLEQLETCLEQCKRLQENYKTLEIFKRTFSAGGTIYGAVFPEGIPVGKNKRICFKGVGKEVLNTLFNSTTTTGIAFQNILDKNNIHISDELLTLVAFGEICLSKVEIKTVETPKDDKDKDNVSVEQLSEVNEAIRKDIKGKDTDYASQELEDVDEYEYEDE